MPISACVKAESWATKKASAHYVKYMPTGMYAHGQINGDVPDLAAPDAEGVLMAIWLQAGLWGLLAGGALVVGALIAWFINVPRSVVATVMAFGAGVLISALAFDLMAEAESK